MSPSPSPDAALPWAAAHGAPGGTGHHGLRLAVHGAFAVVALAVAALGAGVWQIERLRDAIGELQERAIAQGSAAGEAGLLAALPVPRVAAASTPAAAPPGSDAAALPVATEADGAASGAQAAAVAAPAPAASAGQALPSDALVLLVDRTRGNALQMDAALARALAALALDAGRTPGHSVFSSIADGITGAFARRTAPPALHAAVDRWQAARGRLASASDDLLRPPAAVDGANAPRHAAHVWHAEAAAAGTAAAHLSALLGQDARARAAVWRGRLQWGAGGLLALLLTLSLALVEPAARAAARRTRRQSRQAGDLQRLALVAEHTSALVVVSDRDDRVQWINAAYSAASGCSAAAAVGQRPAELLANARHEDAAAKLMEDAVLSGQGARHEWLHRTRDGRDIWLDVDLRPVRTPCGGLSGFVRVATDVTARVRQQAKLQALWAVLPVGVVVHDRACRVVEANREAEHLLGLSLAQMRNPPVRPAGWCPLREDGSPFPLNDHPAARTLATGMPVRNETVGLAIGGGMRWLLFNTEPQRDALGQVSGVVTCISDITERRLLLERLSAGARTDALTRLPNRAVVMERLQRAIAHAQRHPGYGFAVLFMDFDRFKQVNDTLGHAAGDALLRQVAERLQQALRPGDAVARLDDATPGTAPGDAVAARLGGDEFVVVLEGVSDAATAGVIAERLLHDLAQPYLLGSTPVQSSVSIGVVLCTGLARPAAAGAGAEGHAVLTAADVLRNADTAMYEAKRAGRGRWVLFDDSMHERVLRALALESDLKRALRDDELFVVYQPILNLATGALEGVEALVRWRHPQRGLVMPGDFIPAAEENGLIDALGGVVLRKACRQFMAWRRTPGAPAPRELAVNLSRAQLQRPGLVDDVRGVLAEFGMPPALLQLEVTESLAAQDARVQATLRELKALGVRLALDDFGTGYSSLACLHQLPVDTVKIDRSFVQHAETVEYHRVLIEATVRVARTLGMTAVAEGIETEGQAALMRQLDCDRGQGYLFSRPVEAAELERWMRAQAVQTVQEQLDVAASPV